MRRVTPLLLLMVLACGSPTLAQQPPGGPRNAPDDDPGEIALGAELVLLDVSVADKAGRPVTSLERGRFRVVEDGVPQEIDFFSRGEAPASVAFALDTSGSMRGKIGTIAEAATRVLDAARPGDEFALVRFNTEATLAKPFTSDAGAVRAALAGLAAIGQTAVLDAAYLSAEYVAREGRNNLKALVLVTDGLDKNSSRTFDELVARVRSRGVRLYVVGLTANLDTGRGLLRKSEKASAEGLLAKLARETGGRAFFPAGVGELGAINQAIAADLRGVYQIGYYPTNRRRDGTYRSVAVRVIGADGKEAAGLSVRTRPGYVAGAS